MFVLKYQPTVIWCLFWILLVKFYRNFPIFAGPFPEWLSCHVTCKGTWYHRSDWPRDACQRTRHLQIFHQKSHAIWTKSSKVSSPFPLFISVFFLLFLGWSPVSPDLIFKINLSSDIKINVFMCQWLNLFGGYLTMDPVF